MANDIRSNISSNSPRIGTKPAQGSPRRPSQPGNEFSIPERANLNMIPAPESLTGLISRAMNALKKGVFWDRGTILNLLV